MGLLFLNVAENVRRAPPSQDDKTLGTALSQQLIAVALAAVPEAGGMRVEIAGDVVLQADASPDMRALFGLPAVDPQAWPELPADTAVALVGHNASIVWPWLEEMGLVQSLDQLGLDVQADLMSTEGPLTGDFAMAITPPLPEQPISGDVPAMQLLILGHDVGEERMGSARAAMEARGATFGQEEVAGIALQTQVGTRPSGYAISYGFDGGSLLFGSSPEIVGKAVAARRAGGGLVADETFRAVQAALPTDPSLVFYLNYGLLSDLLRTNMTEEQYQQNRGSLLLEAYDAVGLGLQLTPDEINGVLYFAVRE
jgi:hypothetical protein